MRLHPTPNSQNFVVSASSEDVLIKNPETCMQQGIAISPITIGKVDYKGSL